MTTKKSRSAYKKKRYWIPILIVVLLIVFRLFLPTIVKNYVNKVLADIPDYYGQVEDIDIALIRGAYVIKGLYLNKGDAKTQIPFLNFPEIDISVEWKSLFKGRIVSEIIMNGPEIIYVFEDQESDTEAEVEDWTKALTDLVPIDINHFEVHNGTIAFVQLEAEPNIDLKMENVELTADNLRNVEEEERILPSPVTATANSFGNGSVKLNGKVNLIKEVPDMDIAFSLEQADASALNDFTNHYAKIDFESGKFEVFSEIAIADGYLKGYIKPLLTKAKFHSEEDGFLETIWEGLVGFFKFILKNQRTDTFGTSVPIEGDLTDLQAGTWPTIFNIFKNAWIKAFQSSVDDDIEYEDAFQDASDMSKKEKKQQRKDDKNDGKGSKDDVIDKKDVIAPVPD